MIIWIKNVDVYICKTKEVSKKSIYSLCFFLLFLFRVNKHTPCKASPYPIYTRQKCHSCSNPNHCKQADAVAILECSTKCTHLKMQQNHWLSLVVSDLHELTKYTYTGCNYNIVCWETLQHNLYLSFTFF